MKHPVEIDIKLHVIKGEFYNIFFICSVVCSANGSVIVVVRLMVQCDQKYA